MSLKLTSNPKISLTPHPEGSVKELWSISFPLMIAALSTGLMLFFDRLFLAHYSTDALNASVNSGTMATTFLWGSFVLANIAEVFVAQHNGAGNKIRLGEPVWQMMWFSFMTILVFLPLGIWGGEWIYGGSDNEELSIIYFKWLMIFGPIVPMLGALSGFFVGQGLAKYVTYSAIIANVINIGFDYLLIFGVEGFIPEMGIFGAALATGIAQLSQLIYLAALFLNGKNRKEYGTARFQLIPKEFTKCIRIAAPHAISQTIEVLAWALFFYWMAMLSREHITVMGICQSIFVLFNFFVDGISKGASTVAGNIIGAKRWKAVWKVWFSGLKLYCIFFIFVTFCLVVYPEPIIEQFLSKAELSGIGSLKDNTGLSGYQDIRDVIRTCFFWLLIYLFFEGVRFLLVGLLTAAGDTLFLLICGSLSIWLFALIPIYYFVVVLEGSIVTACIITAAYSILTCLIYYWRFRGEKWQSIDLIAND